MALQADRGTKLSGSLASIDTEYMRHGLAFVSQAQHPDPAQPAMTAAEFAKRYVPAMQSIVKARDVELATAQDHRGFSPSCQTCARYRLSSDSHHSRDRHGNDGAIPKKHRQTIFGSDPTARIRG